MMRKRIAILGANSHIARNLIRLFGAEPPAELHLFTRNSQRLEHSMPPLPFKPTIHEGYSDFMDVPLDAVINCVGTGAPSKLKAADWFTIPEEFDNLVLRKLDPSMMYIYFSSGAVYFQPKDVNHVLTSDHYAVMRLYSEAKHRSLTHLNIADIRIFSFFSRFADETAGYFMSDLLHALRNKSVFETANNDMTRDYIAPEDLFRLIQCCLEQPIFNAAIDVFSSAPVAKSIILRHFQEKFGLTCRMADVPESPYGRRDMYVPDTSLAKNLGYVPTRSSLETLNDEMAAALAMTP